MRQEGGAVSTARGCIVAAVFSIVLAACGGGGDGGSGTAPTALPQSLQMNGPAEQNAKGTAIAFASNASPSGVSYQWQFGDGSTSTDAQPSHTYAKPGAYTVQLTVSNSAGDTRTTSAQVYVADFDIVRGKACSGAAQAGWCWQQPLPQGNTLNDHLFLDDLHGWAVGELGTVMVTVDGGTTWQRQQTGTQLPLSSVTFVNAQVGWVTAVNGQFLKTTDGGTTWTLVSTGLTYAASLIGADSAGGAWVSNGYAGEVSVTTDGGKTWNRRTSGAYGTVAATSANVLWAVSGSQLIRTTDGSTWSTIALPAVQSGLYRSLYDLQAVDANTAWVRGSDSGWNGSSWVSTAFSLRTRDGGATWQAFDAATLVNTTGLHFFDADNGYAGSYYGSPWRTTDGGLSWQPVTLPASGYVGTAKAFSARQWMFTDYSGRLYRSTDGGATWVQRPTGAASGPTITGLWFFDSREGLATGADGSLMRTTDGGQTWTVTPAQNAIGWRRPQFLPDGTGWIASDSGTIYRSTDKGVTWFAPATQISAQMNSVSDLHFVDAQHGWATSSYSWTGNTLFRTQDGGGSWQPVTLPASTSGLTSVRFGDTNHGVAVGAAGVAFVTADGGVTWTPHATNTTGSLQRVVFVDAQTAVAVGSYGTIVRSTDAGQTWSAVPSGTSASLQDVRFVSGQTGWAVGDGGTALVTHDGGLSWTAQPTGVSAGLMAAFFIDEQTGWVAGANGSILATATGGR
jgi:photosystem II stability/assembly factor-like uncharacterized protein